MNNSAFVVRNVVLSSLLTLGLAACGAGEGSSSSGSASAAADPIPSLVTPSIGVIDRTSATETPDAAAATQTNVAANTSPSAAPVSSTTATPGSTTVASTAAPAAGTASSTPGQSNNTSTGTTTLDWMPPTENTDGSVLSNLAGYTVYYGTSPSNLTQSVKITNPGLTAYTMSNLPTGTWYFAVTSYSSTGIESARSGIVSTTI